MKKQLCSFKVAGHIFGVGVENVQEVMRHQKTEKVPRAPIVIEGLMNLRGDIVTTIDLRRRLGLPERTEGKPPMHVVVRTEDGPVSLLVDEIGDVVEVEDESFEPPPEALQGKARDLILGAHKLEGQLLLLLSTEKTTHLSAS